MEKRTQTIPSIRVTESLELALMRLSALDDRSLSDYIVRLLEKHCFGHATQDSRCLKDCMQCNAAQCDALHCNAVQVDARRK